LNKFIPRRGLTTPSTSADKPDPLPSSITDLFKGTKRDIIEIITLLLTLDKDIQNTIRELGGIPLILSQCNIDDDNPCMTLL
jgi:ataxin-10